MYEHIREIAALIDWQSVLLIDGPRFEGVEGDSAYLTNPGQPEVTFETGSKVAIRVPFSCQQSTNKYQHVWPNFDTLKYFIMATSSQASSQTLKVGSLSSRFHQENKVGPCGDSIMDYLANLDGRLALEP